MIEHNDIATFKEKRLNLIYALECGKMDKQSFIKANLELYGENEFDEPDEICDLDEGLFYYQYFNSLAKCHQMTYRELRYDNPFVAVKHRELSDSFYGIKERVTYRMLRCCKNEPISAYYVKTKSKKLHQRLVEIVFTDREKIILHTLDKKVIQLLYQRGCLFAGVKPSRIAEYINAPYYKT